jgi:nitrite reductase (NADH) small subunit
VSCVDIGRLSAIPRRGARVLETAAGPIAVFRTSDDRVFALRDRCPHRGGPLSQGIVHGTCVTCPLHDWVIELATGTARAPDEGAVETFAVHVERGRVLLDVASTPASAAAQLPAAERTEKIASEARSYRGA